MSVAETGLLGVILLAITASAQPRVRFPVVTHGELPSYPPIAWTIHLSGTVEIQAVVEKGTVADAQVKSVIIETHSGPPLTKEGQRRLGLLLLTPSLANIKSWHFQSEGRATFVVDYVYRIAGKETATPENPKIEVDLPLIKVTASPFKPTVLYGGSAGQG